MFLYLFVFTKYINHHHHHHHPLHPTVGRTATLSPAHADPGPVWLINAPRYVEWLSSRTLYQFVFI